VVYMIIEHAHERESLHEHLKRMPAFSTMTEVQLAMLRDKMTMKSWKPGKCVFNQGEVGDTFYVTLSGTADVIREDDDGSTKCIKKVEDGDYFGERALLIDEPRHASVKAVTALKCACIRRADFEQKIGPLGEYLTLQGEAQGEKRPDWRELKWVSFQAV